MRPIHKFNGGNGATICHDCSRIISVGLTDDIYCDDCYDATYVYKGLAKWGRAAYLKIKGDRIVFDCSQDEYGPISFPIKSLIDALPKSDPRSAAESYATKEHGEGAPEVAVAIDGFIEGAKWMMEQLKKLK